MFSALLPLSFSLWSDYPLWGRVEEENEEDLCVQRTKKPFLIAENPGRRNQKEEREKTEEWNINMPQIPRMLFYILFAFFTHLLCIFSYFYCLKICVHWNANTSPWYMKERRAGIHRWCRKRQEEKKNILGKEYNCQVFCCHLVLCSETFVFIIFFILLLYYDVPINTFNVKLTFKP